MERSVLALFPAVAAIMAAGCGGSSATKSSSTPVGATAGTDAPVSATVGARTTTLGKILVDSQGRSLYLFEKDTSTASSCSGACVGVWPPLTVSGAPRGGAGVLASKLGVTKRGDGQTEVTYNGHPLYRYVADTAPGQTKGEGLNQFGAGWDVVSPSGDKIEGGK